MYNCARLGLSHVLNIVSFQKRFGLYCEECHKVQKWSGRLGLVWWVCVSDGLVVSGSVDSGCHELSENFSLYGLKHHIVVEISGDVTDAGQTNKNKERWGCSASDL